MLDYIIKIARSIHPIIIAITAVVGLATTSYLMGQTKSYTHLRYRARVDSAAIDTLREAVRVNSLAHLVIFDSLNVNHRDTKRVICILLRRNATEAEREKCAFEQ